MGERSNPESGWNDTWDRSASETTLITAATAVGRNGNAAKSERAGGSRSVGLKEAPDVGTRAALIHRIRKRIGDVRERSGVSRRAIRAVCYEARKRAVFPLEDRIEDATAGKHDNRAVGHGRTPKKEIEP